MCDCAFLKLVHSDVEIPDISSHDLIYCPRYIFNHHVKKCLASYTLACISGFNYLDIGIQRCQRSARRAIYHSGASPENHRRAGKKISRLRTSDVKKIISHHKDMTENITVKPCVDTRIPLYI